MRAPPIHVLTMVKNEAGRFWRSALEAWSTFAETIWVWDDGSEDETVSIAKGFPKTHVFECEEFQGWGEESKLRSFTFEETWRQTREGDYIFVLDGDMTPASDPRNLLSDASPDSVAFPLYDLWNVEGRRLFYRRDSFWRAHLSPRVWMVRRSAELPPFTWSGRGIHSGHLPLDLDFKEVLFAPPAYGLLHYGYATEELRSEKYERYASVGAQLSDFERRHADSILSEATLLSPLPFEPSLRLTQSLVPTNGS